MLSEKPNPLKSRPQNSQREGRSQTLVVFPASPRALQTEEKVIDPHF